MTDINLSGAEIGRLNAERLRVYIEALKAEGKPLPSRAGKPNLSAIALACEFDRQVLYKNPACRELLAQATAEGMLRPPDSRPNSSFSETAALEAKILKLEQRDAARKAEVEELRKRLRQLQHVEEHLIETGRRIIP